VCGTRGNLYINCGSDLEGLLDPDSYKIRDGSAFGSIAIKNNLSRKTQKDPNYLK